MSNTALDILVEGLFDYSGMFPPESKSFEEALRESASFKNYLTRPNMVLADLVLTIDSLVFLTHEQRSQFQNDRVSIALLGSELSSDKFRIDSECELIVSFNDQNSQRGAQTAITSYEVKVGHCMDEVLASLVPYIPTFEAQGVSVALEPDLSREDWGEVLHTAIRFISQFKEILTLKFRGTGPTGIGNDKIAYLIPQIADAGLHLKATGGLHHPFLEERYGNNLGFIGLSAALFLRRGLGEVFTEDDIMGCLCATDPSELELEVALGWRDRSISLDTLKKLKQDLRFSIGSCSIREPDEDLVRIFG